MPNRGNLAALLLAASVSCWSSGCGYVGEPLPPAANIPSRVADLKVLQKGATIIAECSVPQLTTDATVLRSPPRLELGVGESDPATKIFADPQVRNGRARFEIPASPWAGKQALFAVKAIGGNGKDAGWSNLVVLAVVPPLQQPARLRAEAVPEGVRLTWDGQGPGYRVLRLAPGETAFTTAGESAKPQWVDTQTEFGKTYKYKIQAVRKSGTGEAESDDSAEVSVTPADRFAPAIPSGLSAVISRGAVELAWERNTEPDLATYRIYRAEGDAQFQKLAETQEVPAYTDRTVEPGKRYRYAVSAVDGAGNESALSAPAEITMP